MVESTVNISESYSVTLVTSVVDSPVYLSKPRAGTNTSLDFFKFVLELIRAGFLSRDDVFILDNSAIRHPGHVGRDSGSQWHSNVFSPKYSPELNPCELVFAQAKRWLRSHRDGGIPFVFEIAASFGQVSSENVRNYYDGCLNLGMT